MRRVEALFAEYDEHHQTRGNKICHFVGIPMILISVFGLLGLIRLGPIDGGLIFLLGTMVFYVVLDLRLAILAALAGFGLYLIGMTLPLPVLIAFQIIGWTFQFLGHGVWEKRKPAFLRNLPHLLVGPLWILNDLVKLVPPRTAESS